MKPTEPRGAAARVAAILIPVGAAVGILLGGCHPEEVPSEEKYVTIRLHDSLSRFPRVEVLILAADDTSELVGTVWDGRLENPSSLPDYRLSDPETRPLAVRVRGYDSAGVLVHDQLITKTDGRQTVTSLLPPPKPLPNPPPKSPPSVRLSSLAVFPGTLSPAFDSLRYDYQVSLPFEQVSIAVTATAITDSAAILIEGVPVASGVPTKPYDLGVGANELGIRVTVGDSTGLYSLKVDRAQRVDPPDTSSPSDWDPVYQGWKYKAAVDAKVMELGLGQGKRVEGFPLLIRLTEGNFAFPQAAAGGRDLRFTRLGKPVEYEIARWDTAARLAEVWVRLDTLRCDTAFAPLTLYWGNPAATPASDPHAVFTPAAGHSGVWHLSESAAGIADEYRDATGRYHGRGIGDPALPAVPRRVEGVVGHGQAFRNDNAYSAIDLPVDFDPGSGNRWTFQCWVKSESGGRAVLFAKGVPKPAPVQRFQIVLDGSGQQIALYRDGDTARSNVYIGKETFFHIGISYDGSLTKVFVDGIEKETLTGWTQGGGSGGGAVIGSRDREARQMPFQGSLDELWFSDRVRSGEWMRLSFENQKRNSGLVSIGKAATQK